MTFAHRFRVLFRYNKNHEDGYFDNAVVLLRRFDYERYYNADVPLFERELVARYEWKVVIDLWFILVRFGWIGRENKQVKELKDAQAEIQKEG